MFHRFGAGLLAALSLSTPVLAQGFAGAEISADTLAWSDSGDLGRTTYGARLAFDVAGAFGVGADVSFHGFGPGEDGRSATLHGTYNWTEDLAFGGFLSTDDAGSSATTLGVEASATLLGGRVEGGLGRWDGDLGSGTLLLADGRWGLGGFGVTGFAGAVGGDVEATRVAFGGDYRLSVGPTLFAEVGKIGSEGDSEAYLGIGARIALGRDGALMRSRGLLEVAQGF